MPLLSAGDDPRHADPPRLDALLCAAREDTLRTFAAYERALPGLRVPQREGLNPPLWELGHVGWFQAFWIERNPQRDRGPQADPQAARLPTARAGADALYDSRHVAHATRWQLPLPGADATRDDLARQLEATRALLARTPAQDDALYFFRLALAHEDMHHEAALYMAQALGVPVDDPRWQAPVLAAPGAPLPLPGGSWALGRDAAAPGFAFDNEYGHAVVETAATGIDAQVLRWLEFLPFVEAGGYEQPAHWTPAGWQWLQQQEGPRRAPRYLRQASSPNSGWQQWRGGAWQPLDPREPARHLTLHEALAWCAWAGRRLPTEAEWAQAAHLHPQAFRWGDVWEWTATAFGPWPGFAPHPYREYSAPWFDGRPVLRGASFMTQPRLRHTAFRNFFPAARNDIPSGFRTCAV